MSKLRWFVHLIRITPLQEETTQPQDMLKRSYLQLGWERLVFPRDELLGEARKRSVCVSRLRLLPATRT